MAAGWGERGGAFLRNRKVRAIAFQVALVLGVAALLAWLAENTITNLRRANIVSGFDFLGARSGFEIAQTLVAYSADSTYGRALLVGLLNTLLVAALGIVFATVIGFARRRGAALAELADREDRRGSMSRRCATSRSSCSSSSGTGPYSRCCPDHGRATRSPSAPTSTIAAWSCRDWSAEPPSPIRCLPCRSPPSWSSSSWSRRAVAGP